MPSHNAYIFRGLTVLLAAAAIFNISCSKPEEKKEAVAAAPAPAPNPCVLPTAMAPSNEQTAWQLFVAASCPSGQQMTWETWTEQTCFSNPSAPGCTPGAAAAAVATRHLHGSFLRGSTRHEAVKALAAGSPGACNSMTTASNAPAALKPFVPKNVTATAQFCEEVFVDPSEAAFVRAPSPGASLTTLTAQVAYAKTTPINFPTSAVEIKADWLPAASVGNGFNCTTPPDGLYTETIDGTCYALVGIHFSSKLLTDWLWATFEPQNTTTNPNRCNANLYNSCNDPYGSVPATSTGASTALSPAVQQLMTQAGLAKALQNYRLVATQSSFVDAGGAAVQLGNSFIEFNAQVLPHEAACMTCHSYAAVQANGQERFFFGPPTTGTPAKLPAGVYAQDFSWMLGILPSK